MRFRHVSVIAFSLSLLANLAFSSCSKDRESAISSEEPQAQDVRSSKLSQGQALAYAELFLPDMERASLPEQEARALTDAPPKELSHFSYLIEGRDTLLYAINYKDDRGFILVAGDNSEFPILAHADRGVLDLEGITSEHPLSTKLEGYRRSIKARLKDPKRVETEYFQDWKDLGNPEYQYEITPTTSEPTQEEGFRAMRRHSTGKDAIHPETGKALDTWSQGGNFRASAVNRYPIGCPAVAIGMLMYDTENRLWGKHQQTIPSFWGLSRASETNSLGAEVSKLFRQIADSIPRYQWDTEGSGAEPLDILIGLRKLGFKKAELKPYDFETLYNNLKVELTYAGKSAKAHRGVLIGAGWVRDPSLGHIWFCDGYYEQAYQITKKRFLRRTKRWTEYADLLYMNFGWGKDKGNGWYNAVDTDGSNPIGRDIPGGYYIAPMMFINLDYTNPNENY